jgi:hypothetical protein
MLLMLELVKLVSKALWPVGLKLRLKIKAFISMELARAVSLALNGQVG